MNSGLGRAGRKGPTRDELEREAARILDQRVATGRPPPEEWTRAAAWRARHPSGTASWYGPPPAAEPPSLLGEMTDAPFVLKVVTLPPPTPNDGRRLGPAAGAAGPGERARRD